MKSWIKGSILLLCLAAISLCLEGCGSEDNAKDRPEPAADRTSGAHRAAPGGGKVLMVIAPRNFRDEEMAKPRDLLQAAGFSVDFASTKTGPCQGMLGATVEPSLLLKDVHPSDYDAVVFVGGAGATVLFDDMDAHRIAREAFGEGRIVGAICIAPVILAEAGLLDGKKVSVWPSNGDDCESKGATVTGNKVTVDGRLVTGNGPEAAEEFGQALVKALEQGT